MKSKLLLFLGLCACSGAAVGCVSTETGNPSKETPSNPPVAGTGVTIDVGWRGVDPDLAVAGPSGRITGLWLQVVEIDLVSCSGVSSTARSIDGVSSVATTQSITVGSPEGDLCAVVVRTQPLSLASDATLPPEGIDQAAVVQGIRPDGSAFSAAVPGRITSVLLPVNPGLSLGGVGDLKLLVEGSQLMTSAPSGDGISDSPMISEPELVRTLQTRLPRSFSLVRGTPPNEELLATSNVPWQQADDFLCVSACAVEDRAACGATACDPSDCMTQLMDPACGPVYRQGLQCRVGLSPTELACDPTSGQSSAVSTHCEPLLQQIDTCQGAPL